MSNESHPSGEPSITQAENVEFLSMMNAAKLPDFPKPGGPNDGKYDLLITTSFNRIMRENGMHEVLEAVVAEPAERFTASSEPAKNNPTIDVERERMRKIHDQYPG